MDVTKIIELIITILMMICSTYLIPYLKNKYSTEKVKNAYDIIKILVKAVEQVTTVTGAGKKKKEEVIEKLREYDIRLDDKQISDLIESAVKEMNINIKGCD